MRGCAVPARSIGLLLFFLIAASGCEDFLGGAFTADELVAVDWLPGDWSVVTPGKPDEAMRIERLPGNAPSYTLFVEGDKDRIVMRFAVKRGLLVGEYRSLETGAGESKEGVLICLRRDGDGFLAFVAKDLDDATVSGLGIRTEGRWYLKRNAQEPPDYRVLSGTPEENSRAIDLLLETGALFDFSSPEGRLEVRPQR